MAVEAKRGCGYRKIGGTYLEGERGGFLCGRLPLSIIPCPLCDHRIPFTRGLQQVKPQAIARAPEVCAMGNPVRCALCPLGDLLKAETVGLMWVGAKSYTPATFTAEAERLGISKRIPHVPRWLDLGKTWVLLAHEHVFKVACPPCGGSGSASPESRSEQSELLASCDECSGAGWVWHPGIFHAFVPKRVVRIVGDDTAEAELERLRKQGLDLVIVPHDDPDHRPRKSRQDEEV